MFSVAMVIFFCDGGQRVQALVVLRTVHVKAQRLAVGRERVAVGAGVQIGHHDVAGGLGHVADTPGDQRKCALSASGLMKPFSVSEGISGTSR